MNFRNSFTQLFADTNIIILNIYIIIYDIYYQIKSLFSEKNQHMARRICFREFLFLFVSFIFAFLKQILTEVPPFHDENNDLVYVLSNKREILNL